MPACHICYLTPQGLFPAEYSADSLAQAAAFEPRDGVYTITNTFNRFQVLTLNAHLDRMEDSAQREGFALTLDRPRLRAALRQMIADSGYADVRFRVTASASDPDRLILSIEPFHPLPAEVYARGVRCVTVHGARHNPQAKTTDWMLDRRQIEASLPDGIFTGLLVGDGEVILEGLSSNFYAIVDGELRTAAEGVLPGIAQQIVFEVAPAIVPLRRQAITAADLPACAEAFITSSSRGIVPVVEIDGAPIGSGQPGPLTERLRSAYLAWLEAHLEEL